MNRLGRLIKFMFIYIPVTVLNGIRMIVFEDISIDEIMFEVSRPKKNSKKISKQTKRKIVREYLNDCLKKSID